MSQRKIIIAIILIIMASFANAVEFILKPNEPTCTVLVSSFDVCLFWWSRSKLKLSSPPLQAKNKDKNSKLHS